MIRQQNDDNNRYNVPAMPPAVSPIMEPKMPPTTPMMPPGISPITQPNMPPAVSPIMQPGKPMMPPCPYSPPGTAFPPPGTAFNPIGVPPWAAQPGMPSTGMPTTGMPSTQPSTGFAPRTGPPVLTNDAYLQAHLKQYIGRPIRAEFILGTNMFIDREGVLLDVGIDHIVMRETRTDDLLFADIYSIKFVTILL